MKTKFALAKAALTTVAMTLGLLTGFGAQPASADVDIVAAGDFVYFADTVLLTATAFRYDGSGGAVEIPSSVNYNGSQYAVTALGVYFLNSKPVTSVSIPDSVTTINGGAFYGASLTSISLPSSVTSIGEDAFAFSGLTSVIIPSGVTEISAGAFFSAKLASVTIPSGVTSIGASAFAGNVLTSVEISPGVLTIGDEAFKNNSLTSVTIPSTVTSIGSFAFATNPLKSVLFLGSAPAIYPAGYAGSFGEPLGFTLYYLPVYASGFSFLWNGYTAAPAISISGTAKVGMTLTATAGGWPDGTLFSYSWQHSGINTVLGNGSTYTLLGSDQEQALTLTVTVTVYMTGYTPIAATTPQTTSVALGTFLTTTQPLIVGTTTVGQTLTANFRNWWTWSPAPTSLSYQWWRVDSLSARTQVGDGDTYLITPADSGKTLTLIVTANRAGYTSSVLTSDASARVSAGTFTTSPTPTITGTKVSGSVLTAVTTGWVPSSGVTYTYVWKRASTATGAATTIGGATGRTYRLTTADRGKYITVTVTARASGYVSVTKTSAGGTTLIAR